MIIIVVINHPPTLPHFLPPLQFLSLVLNLDVTGHKPSKRDRIGRSRQGCGPL